MKKVLTNGLLIGLVAAVVNFGLAFLLGGSTLDTPYEPGTTEFIPTTQFAIMSGVATVVLTLIGSLILGVLYNRYQKRGIRIWVIIGVVFLTLYGIFPFAANTMEAGILTNILHAVAGFAALYFIPKRLTI